MNRWTKEEEEQYIEMIKSGKTYKEIASTSQRTLKAIKLKLRKLGYGYEKANPPQPKPYRYCKQCDGLIENHGVDFCSRSCAASFNNTGICRTKGCIPRTTNDRHYRHVRTCKGCGKDFMGAVSSQYCNQTCQHEMNRRNDYEKFMEGDDTLTSGRCRKLLIWKHGPVCMKCGWSKENPFTGKTPIELEHKDGNHKNNHKDNLELLCPNCHSLTATYKGANAGNGRHTRAQRYRDGKSY